MSARSFLLSATLVACSHKPEADPALVRELAAKMTTNMPAPAAVRECKPEDLHVPAMTFRTMLALAGAPIADDPEHAAWINPPELDAPAARVLANPATSTKAKRQAAAELLAAPAWLAWHVDLVNAPMALCVKELKIGTVGIRLVRFEKTGLPSCVKLVYVQNDPAVSDAAIAKSDRPGMDPRICEALRDDLQQQYLKKVSELIPPVTK